MDLNEALRRGDRGDVADLGFAQLFHGLLLMQPELGPVMDAVASARTQGRRQKLLENSYRGAVCPPAWTFIARLEQLYKELANHESRALRPQEQGAAR